MTEFGKRCFSCSLGLDRPCPENFYTLGFSDSVTQLKFQPEEVLSEIDIIYSAQVNHDYFDSNGEPSHQTVKYYQGKWKNENIIKKLGDLSDLKGQIDSLLL